MTSELAPASRTLETRPNGLLLKDVSVARSRRFGLREVSCHLGAGRIWGLLGPNGAGKSTLLEAISGALPIAAGTIGVAGELLGPLDRKARARKVALVGRETRDIALSVRALVELGRFPHLESLAGLGPDDAAHVERALASASVEHLAERLVATLSQGEAQRAHFARALCQAPALLLLDEATAHVDLSHREQMLEHLSAFTTAGGTVLMALHDLDLAARHADGLLVLEHGRLVACGTPAEVLTRELLGRVFGVEAELVRDARGSSLRVYGASKGSPSALGKTAP
jgi:iron complex transport system ATP-binding protein